MKRKRNFLGIKLMPAWLILFLLIASGAGAALGAVAVGNISGEININTSGSNSGLLVGAPLCDTIKHSVDDAIEVNNTSTDIPVAGWPPGVAYTPITDYTNLAFSDDVYEETPGGLTLISHQLYRFHVGDEDGISRLVFDWEGYGESGGTLRVYDSSAAVWGMPQTFGTGDDDYSITITDTTDITIAEAVTNTGYVYLQAFGSAVDQAIFADYTSVTATYTTIDWTAWDGFSGPEIVDREFPVAGRCIGVHSDDQTGFEAASELGVGDWWMFMLPVKNAGSQDITARLTMEVPACLNVYIMSPDEIGHSHPRITDVVRNGTNTWTFYVDADAGKQDDADYLYVMLNAHDDCGPDYYTIHGTLEMATGHLPVAEFIEDSAGLTSVANVVDGSGVFTETVYPQSDDGKVQLEIPSGTTGLTDGGDPLTEISIRAMTSPPPPPADGSIIGLTYNFSPDGATFAPPVRVTFTYDPADIPTGVLETNLKLAWWDDSISDWVLLANIVVDTVNKTVSGDLSHFTAFTPLGFAAPTVFTTGSSDITALSARLEGELTDTGNAANVDLYFEWGTDTTYGNTIAGTPASSATPAAFNADTANLTPETTYHFRAKADGGNHGIVYGVDMSFTTPALCTVNTTGANSITAFSANLSGELADLNIPAGHPGVLVGFLLGTSSGGDQVLGTANGTTGAVLTATGPFSLSTLDVPVLLQPLTTYYYRAFAFDPVTANYTYNSVMSFTTPVVCEVNTTAADNITALSANLNGELTSLNVPAGFPGVYVGFTLGTSSGGTEVLSTANGTIGALNNVGPFGVDTMSINVILQPLTTYYYSAYAIDLVTGSYIFDSEVTFTTPDVVTLVTGPATEIYAIAANITAELTSLSIPAGHPGVGVGFELGTSSGNYNLASTGNASMLPMYAAGPFSMYTTYVQLMLILQPETDYYYRAFALDTLTGLYYYGGEMSFNSGPLFEVETGIADNITAVSANLTGAMTYFSFPSEMLAGVGAIIAAGFDLQTASDNNTIFEFPTSMVDMLDRAREFSCDTASSLPMPIPLSPNTEYRFRAWVAFPDFMGGGWIDVAFGDWVTFTTGNFSATVVTGPANSITATSANLTGELTSYDLPAIYPGVGVGFDLQTASDNVSVFADWMEGAVALMTAAGPFSLDTANLMTGGSVNLQAGTDYRFRAWVAIPDMSTGTFTITGYGDWVAFTTDP